MKLQVFSKYMATVFKIYGPHFPKSRTNTHDVREPHDGIGDDNKDVTARVTTWCLGVLSGAHAGNDTTWMATQVGLRPDKACLGGHDAGVSGVDEGVKKASIPLLKQGGMPLSETSTFSGFVPPPKDIFSEDQNCIDGINRKDITSQLSTRFQLLVEIFQ